LNIRSVTTHGATLSRKPFERHTRAKLQIGGSGNKLVMGQ